MSKRIYSYAEALEKSWPHGRVLVGLIEGVAGPKKEPMQLKSLRLAMEKLDKELTALRIKWDKIDTEILRSCEHPLDRLVVEESGGSVGTFTKWIVRCTTCRQDIRQHTRE